MRLIDLVFQIMFIEKILNIIIIGLHQIINIPNKAKSQDQRQKDAQTIYTSVNHGFQSADLSALDTARNAGSTLHFSFFKSLRHIVRVISYNKCEYRHNKMKNHKFFILSYSFNIYVCV